MSKPIATLILLLLLAACGPAAADPTSAPNEPLPARSTPTSDPALLPGANAPQVESPGYPPPLPTATPLPDGYPLPTPTADPYPAGATTDTTAILRPLGEQCTDANTYQYANTQEARAALTAAGITVLNVTTVELMVCEACGCPTSTHYRAEIAATDLSKATALGWTQE